MLLPHLDAFVAVARHGTARRAAEVLHLSQPALSERIAVLERETGTALFVRGAKGMVLTPAGRAFLPHAERALESVQVGLESARRVELERESEVIIGAAPQISAYVLPELIARLRRVRPDVRALVRTGHSEDVVSLVADGAADIGLIRNLNDPRVTARPLFEEVLTLVVRPEHPFAYDERIEVVRLRESVLIMFDRTSSYFDTTHMLFREAGVVPAGTMEVDNIETAKRMTMRGLGIAFLPTTAIADAIESGALVAVTLIGVPEIHRTVVSVTRLGRPSTIPAELMQLLLDIPTFVPGARPRQPGLVRDE